MNFMSDLNQFKNNIGIVLCDNNKVLTFKTYEWIGKTSTSITNSLTEFITEKNICIGLLMKHNIHLPSIITSLNNLGHAFVVLTPQNLVNSITKLKVNWILSFSDVDKIEQFSRITEITTDDPEKIILWKNNAIFLDYINLSIIFCIVQTSGSTGENKIIKVPHKCIESNTNSLAKLLKITSNDFIYWGTPLTFDPSLVELLMALQTAACLVIVPENIKLNPNYLYDALFNVKANVYKGITFLQMVPSVFLRWSKNQVETILTNSTLKCLAFGGENFPREILKYDKHDALSIYNLYGITEVSCWATVYKIAMENELDEIPIGTEFDETIVEVRDEYDNFVETGEGEIVIGSKSRFCLINDESWSDVCDKVVCRKTGDLARRNDKKIFYLCRKNDVIKRYGSRVSLGKIEEIVFAETGLYNKCICSRNNKLLLFICLKEIDSVMKKKILDKLRVKLLHILPQESLPDFIEIIHKFPLNSHGKIDSKTLELMYINSLNVDMNDFNSTEIFAKLLCKYLGLNCNQLDEIKTYNFFEMGGNSILAIQLLTEFKEIIKNDHPKELINFLFEKDLNTCLNFLREFPLARKRRKELALNNKKKTKVIVVTESEIELAVYWKYDLKACVDSSPLVFEIGDSIFVAVGSFSHIFAVIDEKGREKFRLTLPDVIESAPCVSICKKYLYIGCFDGIMYCIDVVKEQIIWKYPTKDRIKCTPCICMELSAIVFGSYDKYVHCVMTSSGKCLWKTFVSESMTSDPIYDSNEKKIYIATIMGSCICLLEKTGEIIWIYKANSPIFGSPCFLDAAHNFILWPDVQGTIHCLSSTGQLYWNFQADGHIYSSLRKYKNSVYFGSSDHNLYILDISNLQCESVKKIGLESAISTTSFIFEWNTCPMLVACCNSGVVYVINLQTNGLISCKLPGEVFSSPSVYGNNIYVGCRDNFLYCIKICDKNF